MATKTTLTRTYQSVAADITALTLIQCPVAGPGMNYAVELVAASSLPAATVAGVQLYPGEKLNATELAVIGAIGALYARAAPGSTAGAVLTLPDA
jgi:hypothetical protein